MNARRGLTLVELLVALVLAGIVGTAIVRMMNTTQRITRVQFGRMDAQQSATAAL
jgi:prepilin-type N-terminal cleavage/methylation domain-containing protein